ncbi:MAG: twin-arginine translocation signal domain-containing protein, partial [Planctomycetota bacterium]
MATKHKDRRISRCSCCMSKTCSGLTRREFMAGVGIAAGGLAMTSLAANFSDAAEGEHKPAPALPLRVQPVLACKLHRRR